MEQVTWAHRGTRNHPKPHSKAAALSIPQPRVLLKNKVGPGPS